ncbi:MAG: hypothetical protein LBG81_05775 [Coriobacteriaceae bacterium]|jgi:hypothetical protein|nr:hypothetical protein [Coriobacteriaceae bacterium]
MDVGRTPRGIDALFGEGLRPGGQPRAVPARLRELEDAVREQSRIIGDLKAQLELHRSRTEALSAREMYKRAWLFVKRNPLIWSLICEQARQAAKCGRRFSLKRAIEDMRDDASLSPALQEDGCYRFNNAYTAALSRMLMRQVPEVRGLLRTRPSKVDRLFPDGGGTDG